MKTKKYTKSLVLAIPLMLMMPVANADWGVTVGLDTELKRYKNAKDDARALLGIEYRGEKFNIDQKAISYDFTNSEKYAIEAILKSNNSGFEASDSSSFKGMKDRDDSVDLGVRGIVKTPYGPITAEMTRDVNASKGYAADLRLGGITPHNKHWTGKRELSVMPLVGVKYQSDKVVDYYYGVKSNEALTDRAAYKGKAATTPYVGLEAQMNLSKRVSMQAGVIYERKADEIKNSSLTNNKNGDVLLNLGITYWF